MNKAYPLAIMAIVIAGYIYRHGSLFAYSHGTIDNVLLVLFLIMLAWLIVPSARSSDELGDTGSHESTRQSLAFRFGKFLRRIFRPGR